MTINLKIWIIPSFNLLKIFWSRLALLPKATMGKHSNDLHCLPHPSFRCLNFGPHLDHQHLSFCSESSQYKQVPCWSWSWSSEGGMSTLFSMSHDFPTPSTASDFPQIHLNTWFLHKHPECGLSMGLERTTSYHVILTITPLQCAFSHHRLAFDGTWWFFYSFPIRKKMGFFSPSYSACGM